MKSYKVLTKSQLETCVRAGRAVNYNRQIQADFVTNLPFDDLNPIVFAMPHEHINGRPTEIAHWRCVVVTRSATITLDVPDDVFQAADTVEVED